MMEECEEVSDRIVIMESGSIIMEGNSDDIKKKFGLGYNLKIFFAK